MELSWQCGACSKDNMVEFDHLLTWTLNDVLSAKGFICEFCGTKEAVYFTTLSLEKHKRTLSKYHPEHKKFYFLFKETLRRATQVNIRGEGFYGKSRHSNLATS